MGWQGPHKVQQGEVQGKEQPQAQGHAGGHPRRKQLCRKGGLVNMKLSMSQHCTLFAKKAKGIVVCTRQSIAGRSKEAILPLCLAPMRPHLEYCVQLQAPSVQEGSGHTGKCPE